MLSRASLIKEGPQAAAPTRLTCCLLLLTYAGLMLLKIPSLLHGRMWAEDGLFLLDALSLPWWQALVTPHTGYIDVTASAAMLIATRLTDLEHVALISVLLALAVQLCPAALLISSRCAWLQSRWALMLALALVATPPIAEEVWLSPVTSQYHLMVCTGLILAFPARGGAIGAFQLALLFLAGLTGPGPALAVPLFILRACLDRSRFRTLQAIILSAGAVIEFVVFCTHPVGRHLGIDVSLLLRIIYVKHALIPLLGHKIPARSSFLILWPLLPLIVPVLLLGGLGVVLLKSRSREVKWLCSAALSFMLLSYCGAIGQADLLQVYPGARYYYAPQVLLSLTLLGVARTAPPNVGRGIFLLIGWLALVGIVEYRAVNPIMTQGPSWRDQIAAWRAAPDRAIVLWPSNFQIRPKPDCCAGQL